MSYDFQTLVLMIALNTILIALLLILNELHLFKRSFDLLNCLDGFPAVITIEAFAIAGLTDYKCRSAA
jgi:hypothetical protein